MHEKLPHSNRQMFSLLSDLSRAIRCCQQEAVFCEDLTFSQFFILDLVAEKGQLRLSELHKVLSVDKSTTTRLVSPLVKQGLVRRQKSNQDSRAINLALTKEGESVRKRVWACISRFLGVIQTAIPEEKRAEVYDGVRIFLHAMQNACAAGPCRI
ncbi:MAG: MarR family transcriptional regulator [Deltaproteobacteria bacterium]|nr:MAG: MarR family transcriptional regulator [Deltaproteobacteria bacterium]